MHIEGQQEYDECKKLDQEIVMAKEVRFVKENNFISYKQAVAAAQALSASIAEEKAKRRSLGLDLKCKKHSYQGSQGQKDDIKN